MEGVNPNDKHLDKTRQTSGGVESPSGPNSSIMLKELPFFFLLLSLFLIWVGMDLCRLTSYMILDIRFEPTWPRKRTNRVIILSFSTSNSNQLSSLVSYLLKIIKKKPSYKSNLSQTSSITHNISSIILTALLTTLKSLLIVPPLSSLKHRDRITSSK